MLSRDDLETLWSLRYQTRNLTHRFCDEQQDIIMHELGTSMGLSGGLGYHCDSQLLLTNFSTGHNLGLGHSGIPGDAYGDFTSVMGYVSPNP